MKLFFCYTDGTATHTTERSYEELPFAKPVRRLQTTVGVC